MDVADPAPAKAAADSTETAAEAPQQSHTITVADIKRNVGLIVRATDTNQTRLTQRAIRNTTAVRTRVAPAVLAEAVEQYVPESHPARAGMLSLLAALPSPPVEEAAKSESSDAAAAATAAAGGDSMETDDVTAAAAAAAAEPVKEKWEDKLAAAAPEVETYVSLLVLTTALREGRVTEAVDLSSALLQRVVSFNRRTLDVLAAKVVFYYSLAYERAGRIGETRSPLLALHRTCCLRHDEMGQATVLNLLLRNLLSQNLLDQAYKLARLVKV
jgi:26S proteasome regulatory subunit N3